MFDLWSEDYIILAYDLEYINNEEFNALCDSIEHTSRILNSYCESVSNNNAMKNDPEL